MREKILIGGSTNTGKTLTIIQMAVIFPDRKIWAFDAEGDIKLSVEEMGLELPNLTVKIVTPDWMQFEKDYQEAKGELSPDDWCCFDMMGVFWDLAQNSFSKLAFGETLAQHQLAILRETKKLDFGGFDGLQHWPTIKKMHNDDIFDDAVRWSEFNVLATTSLTDFSPKERVPKTGMEGLMVSEFGQKLEGEKHNKFRFRTIAIIYQKPLGTFKFKLVKLKGQQMVLEGEHLPEYDFTGRSFFEVYAQMRGIEL